MRNFYFLVVNYNASELITRLLQSITLRKSDRIIIVNNSPEDKSILDLQSYFVNILEAEENLGFGKACNLGLNWIAQQNNEAIVWLINPDAYFEIHTISPVDKAIIFFQKYREISILGTTVYNSEGELTSAGGTFAPNTAALTIIDRLPEDLAEDYYQTDWVSGCSLLINLANFAEVPQFCDRFFLYYEDLDFCLRYSQQGHEIAVTHLLKVIHDTSTITNRNIVEKYRHITQSYLIYLEKYGSKKIFFITNIRMALNTARLLILKPKQGLGKIFGMYQYWLNFF
ncbi:glycosyltransferase family 2 protein [Waterburya agarophytonicola K14]|uniref:Glycosyltransferase family 2 protein n=1 Tax=Waterburya agarophytonicola KI4 TaxID=2874699 RepID=A0A964BPW0_9CYAN|nr:glycosyltransferase family 2 protein [Waterburya agarophytonicola]MCC0175966.1 glycosyltransferase family 2 protein [Waterburya agarophytonicola KI4]